MIQKDITNVDHLPDAPQLSSYANKPIQNFGMNLLYKMGYQDGKGIGKRRQNQLNQPLILKPRPKGQGLGVQQPKQKQQDQLAIGDYVKINSQPHKGLNAILIQILSINNKNQQQSSFCHVELIKSGAKIKMKRQNLTKIGKSQVQEQQKQRQDDKEKQKKKKRLKWVLPNIKAKVIDKKSDIYLQKIIVTEILGQRQFEARQQNGKLITCLRQKDLQTVVPKPGGIVLILKGRNKRQKAKLLQRHKQKQKVVVQTVQELQIINLDEDDVSQYVQI